MRQSKKRGTGVTLFPGLRTDWMANPLLNPLLARAETLMVRRHRGNRRVPVEPSQSLTDPSPSDAALKSWLAVSLRQDARTGEVLHALRPGLQRRLTMARWPRWLYLERAFLDGSDCNDLLFAAVALRSLCEEVRWQHALDLSEASLPHTTDHRQVDLYMQVAHASLAALPSATILQGIGWPRLPQDLEPPVRFAQQALNDYVHPNFGSHIAALRPRSSAAGQILLEAFIAVYESFLRLSWAEAPLSGPHRPLGVGPIRSWAATKRHFLHRTLPALDRAWREEHREGRKLPDTEVRTWLAASPRKQEGRAVRQASADSIPTWAGAEPADRISFNLAQRAAETLEADFPDGAPEPRQQQRFLRFTAGALSLCFAFDNLKVGATKVQLIRQLASGNPLGIHLCLRSLLEHRAVRDSLLTRLEEAWDATAARARPGSPLPEQAGKLDREIGRFLASSKGTAERPTPWVLQRDSGRRTAILDVAIAVKEAFPEDDRFRTMYDVASAVLHGRIWRGPELSAHSAAASGLTAGTIAVIALERLLWEAPAKQAASAPFVLSLLRVVEGGGTDRRQGLDPTQLQHQFGLFRTELRIGVDYWGDGSQEDPFRLAEHLSVLVASEQLLLQRGMHDFSWTPGPQPCGVNQYCDHYVAGEIDCWIELPFLRPHPK